jgi:hypothetical protein
VCLTGATLALFTSDRGSGTIGIITTSGDVDVDIVDLSGNSLEGHYLEFISSSGSTDILFEPGATFYTQGFKIRNEGNIPINFRLLVGKDNVVDVDGKKVPIEEFNQAFDVWITEEAPDGTVDFDMAKSLPVFTGKLDPEKNSDGIYYLVVKMKESVGNEFQGKTYMGIGVTVYAVQGNAEY